MKRSAAISALIILSCLASGNATADQKSDQLYAKCLQQKGITMYGAEWCPHCREQKAKFGDLFSYVKYVDCESNREACREKGITSIPTWILPSGQKVPAGSIEEIAKASGCKV